MGRNFPAIEFTGKKYPDLAFSNVDRYGQTIVENTRTTFRSATSGSSKTALLAGCISSVCVILALIAIAIFLIMRRKRNFDTETNTSEKVVLYSTVLLQQNDTGDKRDFCSDYTALKEQGGYSFVSLDYEHVVLNPSSACPRVTYAEINKDTNKHENVAHSDDSPNAATEQTQNDDMKALYATVNKNK